MTEGGIYVHIPYCKSKCLYCDFYSGGNRIANWDKFINALQTELRLRKEELNFLPATLYFGGGTPSLMPYKNMETLINEINTITGKDTWDEFTIEVNPEDVSEEACLNWQNFGINRISIGIQTLNDIELKAIGRRHNSSTGLRALKMLTDYFKNISVDLMFGLPNQGLISYRESLKKVISLRPSHISSYSLMLEEGTAMTLLEEQGKINLPAEEIWLEMFNMTAAYLIEAGYNRYEISNYALPGYESRHNSNYWSGRPYIGLGPSAHSYDGNNRRRANKNDIHGYISHFNERNPSNLNFFTEEVLSETEKREEMVMTRLRMSKGLDLKEFSSQFGEGGKNELLHQALPYIRKGLMKENSGKIMFTDSGIQISDSIMQSLI